jgi:hypothetical protein
VVWEAASRRRVKDDVARSSRVSGGIGPEKFRTWEAISSGVPHRRGGLEALMRCRVRVLVMRPPPSGWAAVARPPHLNWLGVAVSEKSLFVGWPRWSFTSRRALAQDKRHDALARRA